MRGIAARKLSETFAKRKIAKKSRCRFGDGSSGLEKGSRSAGRILIQPSARGIVAPTKRTIMKKTASRGSRWPKEGRRSNTVQLRRDLFGGEIVTSDSAALHDELNVFEHRNVLERIAIHSDNVGVATGFK